MSYICGHTTGHHKVKYAQTYARVMHMQKHSTIQSTVMTQTPTPDAVTLRVTNMNALQQPLQCQNSYSNKPAPLEP